MDETKLTARLPAMDVEIVHQQQPDRQAEVVTIRITATPSFHAMADWLRGPGMMTLPALWSAPMAFWLGLAQAGCQPWLGALAPRLEARTSVRDGAGR